MEIYMIIGADSTLEEILLKTALMRENPFFCILDGKKLVGIISYADITRYISQNRNIDFKNVTADDISNKSFVKLNIDNMEYDLNNILPQINAGKYRKIPIVDSQDNFIALVTGESFINDGLFFRAQIYELDFWKHHASVPVNNRIIATKDSWDKKNNNICPIFGFETTIEQDIITHTENKTILEIGCGPCLGYLPHFGNAKKRIAIEPLLKQYNLMWEDTLGYKGELEKIITKGYSIGADNFIPELENSVDGLIIARNCLDHSPNWPFVLNNISSYAMSGAYFYLWTEIHHCVIPNEGHYNITPYPKNMQRIVENLGFRILEYRTNTPERPRNNLYVELIAVRK